MKIWKTQLPALEIGCSELRGAVAGGSLELVFQVFITIDLMWDFADKHLDLMIWAALGGSWSRTQPADACSQCWARCIPGRKGLMVGSRAWGIYGAEPVLTCLIKGISNKPGLHRGISVDGFLPRPPFLRAYPEAFNKSWQNRGRGFEAAAGLALKAGEREKHPKLFVLLNRPSAPPHWGFVGWVFGWVLGFVFFLNLNAGKHFSSPSRQVLHLNLSFPKLQSVSKLKCEI